MQGKLGSDKGDKQKSTKGRIEASITAKPTAEVEETERDLKAKAKAEKKRAKGTKRENREDSENSENSENSEDREDREKGA